MCLGIPGRVIEVRDEAGLAMGKVDFGGVRKDACLAYLPEVRIGDYVIVHVGFAISRVDEDEAKKTLEILDGMGVLTAELQTLGPGMSEPAVVSDGEADDGLDERPLGAAQPPGWPVGPAS